MYVVITTNRPERILHGPFELTEAMDFYERHKLLGEVGGAYTQIELLSVDKSDDIMPIDAETFRAVLDALR